MEKDFYLNENGLAAYFEKDWIDHVSQAALAGAFRFAPFDRAELYSPYHEELGTLIAGAARASGVEPARLLEIGSSLGRGFYELCKNFGSLRSATIIEPSAILHAGFRKIFADAVPARFPVLKGFAGFSEIEFATAEIRARCAHVEITSLNQSFQDFKSEAPYDLVVCSNVIDQCKDPRVLAEVCKRSTAAGGLLALSCTYQWQNKYTGNAVKLIANIHELFGPGWRLLGEADIPFSVRSNERYWLKFLSHAVVYRNETTAS